MLADVLPYLRCPVCRQPLVAGDAAVRCRHGHSFDVARQGYVDLAAGRLTHAGDPPAMVAAREAFQATGGYDFIAYALAAAAANHGRRATARGGSGPAAAGGDGLVVDVGGGTGYHLARVLDALPGAVGLTVDAAKPALRRAARVHPRAAAVRADAWRRLPVAGGAAAVLLDVFAPRHGAEFRRVLAPGGVLLVVTPTEEHLAELGPRLGGADGVRLLRVDPEKPARMAATLAPWFRLAGESIHRHRLALTRTVVRALIGMTPSAAHTDPAALSRAVAALPEPLPVTAAVRLTRFFPVDLGVVQRDSSGSGLNNS